MPGYEDQAVTTGKIGKVESIEIYLQNLTNAVIFKKSSTLRTVSTKTGHFSRTTQYYTGYF